MATLGATFENVFVRLATIFDGGKKLSGTITRRTRTSSSSNYDPQYVTQSYACTCLWDEFTDKERAGGGITDNDSVILIGADPGPISSAGVKIQPESGDNLTVSGTTYEIKGVEAVKPGGVPVIYRAMLRG